MTISVSFGSSQVQVDNGDTGVQLSQVILPYSIRNSEDSTKYLGGQMTLFPSDGIKLSDNTKDWEHLALIKIKEMVADAEIYVPDPIIEVPEELPTSSEAEAPVSSADDSVTNSASVASSATSEAPVASSPTNSLAISDAIVENSASTQEVRVSPEPVEE